MQFINALSFIGFVPALTMAVTTVTVQSTVYYCPCTSTGLASSLPNASTATASPVTVQPTPGTSTASSIFATTSAPSACIPLNGDCTNATDDFFCCSGLTCDGAYEVCIPDDVDPESYFSTYAGPTGTAVAATATQSSCIALGGDCTNETDTFFCCGESACDSTTNTCVDPGF